MNRYQTMVNNLPVPEGQAERLRAAVLAAEPGERGRRPCHLRRRGRKSALAAAVAAAVLLITAAASEAADWDPVFLGIFGASSQSVPGAEGAFQDVQAVSVCGDVTLRVRQAMGDKGNLYLLLDYQLPEGTDMEAAAAGRLRPSNLLVYRGRQISWEEVQPLEGLPEASETFGADSISGMSIQVLEADPETRTVSMMIECTMNWSPLSRLLNAPVSLIAGPPALMGAAEDREDVPLADHLAAVSFTPEFHVRPVKGSARTEDGASYKAEVSPLSLSVRIKGKGLPDWAVGDRLLPAFKALAALRFRDGTVTPVTDLEQPGGSAHGGSSLTHHDGGSLSGTLTLDLVFETFLDPEQVEAVLVGDVEIPVS